MAEHGGPSIASGAGADPHLVALRLYAQRSDHPAPDWRWVDQQLREAGTYWVVTPGLPGSVPHPRPVWGVWAQQRLALSVGSPTLLRLLARSVPVAVHLDSGTDVVIMQGASAGTTSDLGLVATYDAKYDWKYDLDEYGPLVSIVPTDVLAWRSRGWAGREGFQETGRWLFRPSD